MRCGRNVRERRRHPRRPACTTLRLALKRSAGPLPRTAGRPARRFEARGRPRPVRPSSCGGGIRTAATSGRRHRPTGSKAGDCAPTRAYARWGGIPLWTGVGRFAGTPRLPLHRPQVDRRPPRLQRSQPSSPAHRRTPGARPHPTRRAERPSELQPSAPAACIAARRRSTSLTQNASPPGQGKATCPARTGTAAASTAVVRAWRPTSRWRAEQITARAGGPTPPASPAPAPGRCTCRRPTASRPQRHRARVRPYRSPRCPCPPGSAGWRG